MRCRTSISALPLALLLAAAAPAFADAQQHAQAAKKAERHGDWSKALDEWKAAYSQDVNAEYLIGIGDAYAKLGNKAEAKKNYQAYLNDPLALPSNAEKVKSKVASLDAGPGLELPGAGPGLDLPGAVASAPASPGLDLPGAPPAETGKRGKRGKKGASADLSLPSGPGLELPGAAPAEVAKKPAADPGLGLPALDLAAAAPPPSKKGAEKPKAVASASPGMGLELPGALPAAESPKPQPVAVNTPPAHATVAAAAPAAHPPAHDAAPSHAQHDSSHPGANAKQLASASPTGAVHAVSVQPERKSAPEAAIAEIPERRNPETQASSGSSKAMAYVTAGVALAALGGGAYAYTLAGSAHSNLTGSIHDGATAQGLLETEKRDKTISFIGLAGGLVAAGIATALFAF